MSYPAAVIDVHCHAFNARHLPLEGMFRRYHTGKWIARRLAAIVNRVTGVSFPEPPARAAITDDGGPEHDSELALDRFLLAVESTFRPLEDRAAATTLDRMDLETELSADPLFQELVELQRGFELSGESSEAPTDEDFDPKIEGRDLAMAFADADNPPIREFAEDVVAMRAADLGSAVTWLFRRALRWLVRKAAALMMKFARDWIWEPLKDLATFISRVVSSEAKIFQSLLDSYQERQNVQFHVHHMMDMEHGYVGKAPFYRYPSEQLDRMKTLAQSYPDRLIGFAAFDPRRPDWEPLFHQALELGFCGFKFYPSMGYLPWNNPDAGIQQRVEDFFKLAADKRIPVFTHCSPGGVQAQKGSGLNADPDHWAGALAEIPHLRLGFGHGGGGKEENGDFVSFGWYAKNDTEWQHPDNYARKVVKLCRKYKHVYCGVGELHEIVDAGSWEAASFAENFLREWRRGTEAELPWAFADKCVYGSDNYMLKIARKTSRFLDVFAGLLADADFKRFCFYNATNFLDLRSYVVRLDTVPGMERQARRLRDVLDAMGA